MKTTCRILSLSLVLIAAVTMLFGLAKPTQAADTAGKAQTLGIISGGKSSYVIVTPKASSKEVESAAQELRDAIRKKTWVSLKVKTDLLNAASKKSDTEILIGHTNRAESAEVMKDVPYGEYAIRVVNQKIVIAAWDDEALAKGCEAFAEYAENKGKFRSFSINSDYTASGVAFEGVGAVPPYEDKGITTRYMDLADECYMVHIANTSRGDFLKYVKSLPGAGFTEYSYRQAGKMLYAIYGNEDTILHLSFNSLAREVRIAVEEAYDRTIFTEQPYEKICEPSVSMIGQEFTDSTDPSAVPVSNGLCLVFRLEDGRFIIVDSGATVKSVNLLYRTLQKLHVNEGKITVAAWILTHPHGDHTGGFQYLSKTALKNQIVVENIIHHFASDAQHAAIKTAGTSANTRLAMKRFRGANIIKAHSGQVIQAGGAEVEMLFTYADMEPMVLDQMNTTSLILRVTVQENSVMVLADTTSRAINHIYKVYGNYLKSDMVQLAHHGVNGGVLLYQAIDADVVLWPIAVDASYNQGVELIRDVAYNKVATDLAEEVYVAGNAVFTLILPYTPPDNASAVFYLGKK